MLAHPLPLAAASGCPLFVFGPTAMWALQGCLIAPLGQHVLCVHSPQPGETPQGVFSRLRRICGQGRCIFP